MTLIGINFQEDLRETIITETLKEQKRTLS